MTNEEPLNWDELWDEDENRFRVQTRDGRKVRIWVIDAWSDPSWPIKGEFYIGENAWREARWRLNGRCLPAQEWSADLIPEPRTVRRWVNVYRGGGYQLGSINPYDTEDAARKNVHLNDDYIATVPVEWEES